MCIFILNLTFELFEFSPDLRDTKCYFNKGNACHKDISSTDSD